QFSTDIFVASTTTPTVGVPVAVGATVRNFSLAAYNGANGPLQVAFYSGDPNAGGLLIGTQTIPSLLGQGVVTVTQTLTPPAAGCLPIWVVLEPNNQIQEVHKANNQGWFNLTVFQPNGQCDDPCGVRSVAARASGARPAARQGLVA